MSKQIVGTILSYVFYWIAVIVVLVYMKWSEGRTTIFGYESRAGKNIRFQKERNSEQITHPKDEEASTPSTVGHSSEKAPA